MEYDDFSIWFQPGDGHSFDVVAQSSDESAVRGKFTLPVRQDELGCLLRRLGAEVRRSGSGGLQTPRALRARGQAPELTPKELGGRLFEALFRGRVRVLFDRCWGRVEPDPEKGLRIRLHFDLERQDLVRLSSLPWEYLYARDDEGFLSFSQRTPVVRHLSLSRPARQWNPELPLRVLVAMSSPPGMPPLDLAAERRRIEDAWGRRAGIEPVFLDRVTLRDLRRELAGEESFHVLHFMGHAELSADEGVLVLHDADGDAEEVRGSDLATILGDRADLGLVVLNACDTARAPTDDGRDPFAGVATALVRAGVPAVVAMQFPISDRAAVAFGEAFYEQLVRGEDLETATVEGRKAILSDHPRTSEWGTPVLFERTAPRIRSRDRPPAEHRSGLRQNDASGAGWRGFLKHRVKEIVSLGAGIPVLFYGLGLFALYSREGLLGLDERLSYPHAYAVLVGLDFLTTLPRNALWALFCGEPWLLAGSWGPLAALLLVPASDHFLPEGRRKAATGVVLAFTWVLLLFGVRFYQAALYPTPLEETAGPAFDVRPGGPRVASVEFEAVSWLKNDAERNGLRRQALAGVAVWLLLTAAWSGFRAWRHELPRGFRPALLVAYTVTAALLMLLLPRAFAVTSWGLEYPALEVAQECRGELGDLEAALSRAECCLFAVSAGGRPWKTLLWGAGCPQATGFQTWSEEQAACFLEQGERVISDDC